MTNPTEESTMNTQPITVAPPAEFTIADTCMLAVYKAVKISTTRRADKATESRVRREENDESITINRHLFQKGEVRDLFQLMDKGYNEHIAMTAAWADKGPRILPGEKFEVYAKLLNEHIEIVAQARRPILQDWNAYVAEDIRRRETGGQRSVSIDQYPDQYQIQRAFVISWRVMPIADVSDFRVAIPEYAKQQHKDYLNSAITAVKDDLLKRLLTPIQKASERLSIPIGEKHANFKDSLVVNMQDALREAKALNVGGDPDVADAIVSLECLLAGDKVTPESLRTQQSHRDETAAKLDVLSKQFAGLV